MGNEAGKPKRILKSMDRHPLSIEAAVARLVGKFHSEFDAAQVEGCRVSEKTLSKYVNPDEADRHIPVDVLLALEKACGTPVITRYLAGEQGFGLVRLERGDAPETWRDHHFNVAAEGADVVSALTAALADKTLTPNEAVGILKEIDEAITAYASLRANLRAFIETPERLAAVAERDDGA